MYNLETNATEACAIYQENIKYVKSMINLWKDEYIRRKRLKITVPLPDVFTIPESELQGESPDTYRKDIPHDQLRSVPRVKEMVLDNLRNWITNENEINQEYFVDQPDLNPIGDYRIDEKEASSRWGHQYFKELKQNRERWAHYGTGINDENWRNEYEGLDTLDIMENMKNQYAEMYK